MPAVVIEAERRQQRCGNCAFWAKFVNREVGECRRYPPTVLYMEKQGHLYLSPPRHPETDAYDWCGEWGWTMS